MLDFVEDNFRIGDEQALYVPQFFIEITAAMSMSGSPRCK